MTAVPVARVAGLVRAATSDALRRGSLLLLANTTLLAVFGFVFWAMAARMYPASAVGALAGVTAGVGLLGAVAALGLPNTLMRHLASARDGRELAGAAISSVATLGGAVCLAGLLLLGPHLPGDLRVERDPGAVGLITVLAVVTSVSAVIDAGLIALRAARVVLLKNLAGSVAKVGALAAFAAFSAAGTASLVLAFSLGAALAAVLGGLSLSRLASGDRMRRPSLAALRRHLSFSAGTYAGTVLGILPLTVVPLMVLAVRGAEEAAWFAVAYLLVGFLNFIPSTTAQVLLVEVSRGGAAPRAHLRNAARLVAALLVPAVAVLLLAAPLVLRLFGPTYADGATGCLRMLALGALAAGGTYLVDAFLAARDRVGAYIAMNAINAALVLALVAILLPHGLTAAGAGWAVAQAASLVVGLGMLGVRGSRSTIARGVRHRAA